MPSSIPLLALYCSLIVAASLVGGMIPLIIRLTHQRVQLSISFVSGFMLGVALLLLLPHAIMESPAAPAQAVGSAMLWMLLGLLVMFFIERFFSFHHHDAPEELAAAEHLREQSVQVYSHDQPHQIQPAPQPASPLPVPVSAEAHAHAITSSRHEHAHAHKREHKHASHHHPHAHSHAPAAGTALTWSGAAMGLTLHSILDGVALAAAVESGHGIIAGLAVFFVILLHKPFDSLTLVTLMGLGGWSQIARHVINGAFALTLTLGVAIFYAAGSLAGHGWIANSGFISAAMAFSAGSFLCIALSDLLPELQFHRHDRLKLSAALLFGVLLAWTSAFFESHAHDHAGHEHAHSGHDAHGGHDHHRHDHDHPHNHNH
jgi:zinc and cadmium transporter